MHTANESDFDVWSTRLKQLMNMWLDECKGGKMTPGWSAGKAAAQAEKEETAGRAQGVRSS
eukprot:6172398-Pleurochrysis_carterae.AAC.1